MTLMTLSERVAQLPAAARQRLLIQLGVQRTAPSGSTGSTTLVGYYVSHSGADIPADELRQFLGSSLPAHLVPQLYHRIAQVPRTVHGKVDTSALPDPIATTAPRAQETSAAPNEVEEQLLAIWKLVLGVKRLDRRDSFFELGGDSLLAIRLLGQIRDRWNIDLSMADLFGAPTVAGAAAQIESVLWARSSGRSRTTDGSATPAAAERLEEEEF
jgi:acyl carrier protein